MSSILTLLTIKIGIDPNLFEKGGLLITWHGVFTAVGIALGVWIAVTLGRRFNYSEDDGYSVALCGVIGGIIGARGLYVMENWHGMSIPVDIFKLNEGGISIWGAVLGGIVGGLAYGLIRRLAPWRGMDVGAMGLILGMAIGRIGDLINGEHFAKASGLPWAFQYTNYNSPSCAPPQNVIDRFGGNLHGFCLGPQHPATTYEMLGDLLILGVMAAMVFRFRLKAGYAFAAMLILYSAMRFGVSYLRVDSAYVISDWITVPQLVSIIGLLIGIAVAVGVRLRPASWPEHPAPQAAKAAAPAAAKARR